MGEEDPDFTELVEQFENLDPVHKEYPNKTVSDKIIKT